MALELAKNAEELVNDFFQRDDALARLGDLFSETFAVVDRDLKPPRPHEFTQNVLDLAMQKLVEHLSWSLLTESDATPRSVGVPALLDLCIAGVANGHLINSAPYKVLEDLMEGQTISTCEKLWDLLESRKEKLTKSVFIAKAPGHTTKASLCLLRMCNALLRRLSKTHNSVFCGKILVFLSFTFALSERSAVNHTGKANVTNVTLFEDEEAFDSAETTDAAKVSEVVPGLEIDSDPSADSGPIDYNLYRTFWDLQRFFRNHQTATQSADNWETFFSELNVVLAAFEGNAFSPDDLERSRDLTASNGGGVQSADIAMDELEDNKAATEQGAQEHFFQPKYLTNSRLFRLQLRDPILRECMLTQFLILFNDLTKVKPPVGSTTPKSKLTDLNNRVVALLRQTPSDGEGFSEMVSSVLERERNWIKWKQEKCPPYEKYPPALEEEAPSSKPSKPLIKRVRRNLTSPLLEQILSESSKPSQILEKIKGKERATEVSLATYTDRFKEAWDPENGIEEEYWPDKDAMVCWRTMRASMKGSVTHLNLAVNGTGALVKGILGLATSESTTSKDAPTASGSTPRQETTPSPRATAVEERPAAIKNEPKEPAESVHAASNAKSSGVHSALKRERSDSFKRAQNGNEPPVKRERVGRIRIRDDDMEREGSQRQLEGQRFGGLPVQIDDLASLAMSDEESDGAFDYETYLLAMQVQKYYYHGFFPVGIWVIWSLLRADCYDLSGRDSASGSIVLLRLLLHYKADINAISKLHETALIVACRNKRMRTIKFLLKRGSRTDLVDRTGYSALRWAVTHEHVAMVKLLLRYNASVTKDCYTGESALELARKGSSDRHAAILKELEKKLAIERQTLLLELVDKQRQDAIDAIDDHRKNREATQRTDVMAAAVTVAAADSLATATLAPSASAKPRKPRVRRASSNQKVLAVDSSRNAGRRLTVGTVFEAGVPTPVERVVAPQLEELDDSTSSRWIKVGASKWQTRERLQQQGLLVPDSAVASPPPTTVEAYDESVRELLTSDGKWRTFLAQEMNAGPTEGRASQAQLTLEDLD